MEGYVVRTAEDGAAALAELVARRATTWSSATSRCRTWAASSCSRRSASTRPNVLTVIMTGFGTVETAIDAMKRGAYDYILKPFKVEEVVHIVQRGLEKQRLPAENMRLKEALSLYKVSEAIAASLSLDEVLRTVDRRRDPRGRTPTLVSTWLDDGEGGFFERARVRRTRSFARRRARASASSIRSALDEHFADDTPLREHGARRACASSRREPGAPRSQSLIVGAAAHAQRTHRLSRPRAASRRGKRFDEGQRKLLSIVAVARRGRDRERAALRGPAGARSSRRSRASRARSTRWTATPRATPSASRRYAQVPRASSSGSRRTQVEIVRQAALMHDIGKIGCVLNLNKPGKLTQRRVRDLQEAPRLRPRHPRADRASCTR